MTKWATLFWVTDIYPEGEVEAGNRDEAIKLYQDLWKAGKLSGDILKDARYSVVSVKPKK